MPPNPPNPVPPPLLGGSPAPVEQDSRLADGSAQPVEAGAGGGVAGGSIIIWRPGGVPGGDVVVTDLQVKAAIVAAQGALEVRVDPSIAPAVLSAAVGVIDCKGSTTFSAYEVEVNLADPGIWATTMLVADGATLANVRQGGPGLSIYLDSKTAPGMTFPVSAALIPLLRLDAGTILLTPTATRPTGGIEVTSGQTLLIEMFSSALLGAAGGGQQPVFIDAGGSLSIAAFTGAILDNDPFAGPAGGSLTVAFDASCAAPPANNPTPFPSYGGTLGYNLVDESVLTIPSFGVTAQRPVPPNRTGGQPFFDATLVTPIWFSPASVWIGPTIFGDATGKVPTAAPAGGAVTAVLAAGSDDTAGQVDVTSGGGGMGAGTVVTVSFTAPLASGLIPRVVVSPSNQTAAVAGWYVQNITAAGFDVALLAVTGGHVTFDYVVVPRMV